ncbi:GNAT family N-acetyltransferase [Microbulbifer flavimaris]|uniref:GNAT family N-acetyltransferase n=1 Tax=Microbulbifer flavimaris TaxID=1781068 RepID=A0ABX4HXF0_9GAMM|nr:MULTISPECIES: GNAT family N-acetyltransferase [Microbulbifer]KUJ82589.1 hypothetical protein AVO43_12410 [Microbulbifer sp. ZGT114]PCO04799.1 GNAT family N-acetyltransferase [Microbulbifer flavimaris]
MEEQTFLSEPDKAKEPTQVTEKSGPSLSVEMTFDGARELMQAWERLGLTDPPRVATANAEFFLPFLTQVAGEKMPYVALWKKGGAADGILIGRLSVRRPIIKIGKWRVPAPKLRTLNITEGGFEALSAATALEQKNHLQDLLAGGSVDCISIFRLPTDGETGKVLSNGLERSNNVKPLKIARWFTELTDGNGQPVIANSSKTRSGFRRKDRKLVEAFDGSVEVREVRAPEEVADFLKMAVRIVSASYQKSIGVGVQDDDTWKTTSRMHAENGNFRGYLLEAKGEPIAYIVGPVVDGTFTLLATSFLPEYGRLAPGTYLLRRVIERLQEEGIRWLDYGIGDYDYKELYGTMRREDALVDFYGSSARARVTRWIHIFANSTTVFLQESGLLTRLKRARRFIIDLRSKMKTSPN